jgi:hypothetical protein
MDVRDRTTEGYRNDTARLSKMIARESHTARSRQLRARTLEIAARSAATEDRVAAALTPLAASNPRHLSRAGK